jgi:flagellar biosynthesis/type III secretory pathway protein FliH
MPHDQNFKGERYQQEYTDEATAMSTFAERFRAEGRSQGIQQGMERGMRQGIQLGMQRGEVAMLVRLLERKFGPVPEALRPRIEAADERSLLEWSERVLSAATLEDVFQ